jgi:ABC-type antimicrobial peptide transport system permease subunit
LGVRLALGATPRHLVRLVLRRGVTLAFAGIIIGVATSLVLVRTLQSLLYETPPHDPVVPGRSTWPRCSGANDDCPRVKRQSLTQA